MYQGIRGIWFYVTLKDSEWIPVLAQNGFDFHHARPEDGVAMTRWLPENEPSPVITKKNSYHIYYYILS